MFKVVPSSGPLLPFEMETINSLVVLPEIQVEEGAGEEELLYDLQVGVWGGGLMKSEVARLGSSSVKFRNRSPVWTPRSKELFG